MKQLAWVLTVFVLTPVTGGAGKAAERPNILFMLVDDLAWSDAGCYGHLWHATPHIDRLAADGMRFTDAYAPAPICSASRAGFLTGKTPARLHFEFVTKERPGRQQLDAETPLQAPPFTLNLPLAEVTIAERLAAIGYETAFFGKWHLNAHHQRYLGWSPTHGPPQQGFQVAVEDFGGHPYSWGGETPPAIETVNEFPADSMVERAAEFLRRDHDRPFFLMVSAFYVHTPVRTQCRWLIERYEKLIPADSPNREQRVRYAAFVETLDHYIGRIMEALDESGLGDETLVVFTSDNGGHPEYTANGPLRGSKWNLYEGGIRVPLIARWPGHIPPAAVCRTPVVGYDLLPTFVEVTGELSPDVDGISLTPLFEDPDRRPDRDLIWHFPYYHPERGYADAQDRIGVNDFAVSRTRPQSALRRRQFKLLRFYEDDRVELYDLSADVSEQHDLSAERPDVAAELGARLTRQLEEMDVRYPEVVRPGGAD
jgi:uncharacterized sulfatase